MAQRPVALRESPRISANDLALFMVSSDTARMGIIRRAKAPQTPPIIRYKDARRPICAFLTDDRRDLNPLVVAEQMFARRADDPAESALRQDDARQSIEVLHALQRMGNQLAAFQFVSAPTDQSALVVAGVAVSIRADMLVHATWREENQIGGAVLRMTQDDAGTAAARDRRQEMGRYVATLVRRHLDENIASNRTPANRLCLSIDVQHGEVFAAPTANTRRMNDVENACRVIAAMWDRI
jgi:hypothetical protein